MFSFYLYNSMSTSISVAYKQSEEEDIQKFKIDRITGPAWNPELETWKHESMFSFYLYNSMSTSISVAYKQSEEEDIQKFQLERITEPVWNQELET